MNYSDQTDEIYDIYEGTDKKIKKSPRKFNEEELIEKNYGILEKYPLYEIKPIKWNPPPAYFQTKKQIDPPADYIPPPKVPPREVNPENLSENQKHLYGKNLYEKDLEIIKNRNSQIERQCSKKKGRSSSVKTKPPDIFYREEAERQQKNEMLQRYEDQIKRKNRRKAIRERKNFEKSKIKADEIKAARDYDRKIQFELYEEERRKEIKKRLNFINSIHINPERPTRASTLKEETAKKKIQRSVIEERRKQFNKDMKNEVLREQTKKIVDIVDEMNPKFENNEKMKKRKLELIKNERGWHKWLALTEQTNKIRETMIERLYSKYDI